MVLQSLLFAAKVYLFVAVVLKYVKFKPEGQMGREAGELPSNTNISWF